MVIAWRNSNPGQRVFFKSFDFAKDKYFSPTFILLPNGRRSDTREAHPHVKLPRLARSADRRPFWAMARWLARIDLSTRAAGRRKQESGAWAEMAEDAAELAMRCGRASGGATRGPQIDRRRHASAAGVPLREQRWRSAIAD